MCLTRSVIVGGMVEKAPKTKKRRKFRDSLCILNDIVLLLFFQALIFF